MKNKTKLNILLLIIIILVVFYYKWDANNKVKKIKGDIKFVSGIVLNSSAGHRGSIVIKYKFYYKDSIYNNSKTMGLFSGLRNKFNS
jgi:hypothetical protein